MSRYLSLLFISLALLTGCKSYEGNLDVSNAFTVEVKKDQPCRGRGCVPRDPTTETVKIPKGIHNTEVSFNSSDEMELDIELPDGDERIELEIPKNSIPDGSGPFTIEGEDINQNWDLQGDRNIEVNRSRTFHRFERCTYTERERVCYYDHRGRRRCRYEYRTYQGRQEVEYYNQTTRDFLDVNFVETPNKTLANFSGVHVKRERIYLYQGLCR